MTAEDQAALTKLAFRFPNPGQSLAELVSAGSRATSFSGNLVSVGSVSVPDTSTTLALLGLGLCGLIAVTPRVRKA